MDKHGMKEFILGYGRIVIDIIAWCIFAGILLIIFDALFIQRNPGFAFWTIIVIPALYVLFYFLLYLFIDIRDKLEGILEELKVNNMHKKLSEIDPKEGIISQDIPENN